MRKNSKQQLKRPAVRPIHPFPARMATSIALDELRNERKPLRVLDPMVGSGTTLVVAKNEGHRAIGFDTDPMAVLLARAWCLDIRKETVRKTATRVLKVAIAAAKNLKARDAYPCPKKDYETRAFIRYWFDNTNRRQLTVLSRAIKRVKNESVRTVLWCVFSKMIITKQASVSLAMDLAHSRPHRVRDRSNIRPFRRFLSAMEAVIAAAPFRNQKGLGKATVRAADARRLPLPAESIDLVITSPPYLNAIDYLRCHKFSLVWMGYSICGLRDIRATNIGSEVGLNVHDESEFTGIIKQMTSKKRLPTRYEGMLNRYVADMHAMISEIARVLVPGGRATLVVGNSTLRGIYVRNSRAITALGQKNGLRLVSEKSRILPSNRRYLPPPTKKSGVIHSRMKTEVVMVLRKPLRSSHRSLGAVKQSLKAGRYRGRTQFPV